ncbi:unnamed protein product [Moneuplotes crassus]|uniref:Uncharacterized protein n=1 Tax=Euplotes crassus TaxID=5936 RepID=A0AAD1U622_EUPCR|nr:unnamed protein product [Moneuplotes crassus]
MYSPGSSGTEEQKYNCTETDHLITQEKVHFLLNSRNIILANLKLYKYAISHSAVYEQLPRFTGDGEAAYNFSQGYASYPSGGSDVCQTYLEPVENCVLHQSPGPDNCTAGFEKVGSFCFETCGDGVFYETPQVLGCDDGNTVSGDGCDQYCQEEGTPPCYSTHLSTSICEKSCGNGIKQSEDSEECDDGNLTDGDGCASNCTVETGYSCSGADGQLSQCIPFVCGDGKKQSSIREECDDGNLVDWDGCHQDCTIEAYYKCTGSDGYLSQCTLIEYCGDGKKQSTNSEECDDGNNSSGDGCDRYCKIEPKNVCTGLDGEISICSPQCGNGVRDSGETCDDKNSMSLDGCDYSCNIEENYICTNDVALARDICISKYFPPIISKNVLTIETSEIVYTFNDSMIEHNFTGGEISMSVSSPSSSYEVVWIASFEKEKELKIKYSIIPEILGGNGEILQVSLEDVNAFTSQDNMAISNSMQYKYQFGEIPASATTEATGSGATIMFFLTFGFSIGVSVLTGSSMELMWSLTNTLQIVFILGLLRLHYPSNLKAVYSYMKYSNFDNPITKKLSEISLSSLSFVSSPINEDFEDLGFGSSNVIINSLDKIFLIFLLGLTVILVYLLFLCFEKKKSWIAKKIDKVDKSLRYESSTRFIVEISMNLCISIMINVFYGSTDTVFEVLSLVFAIVLFFLLVFVFLYATIWPMIYFKDLQIYPDHHERHCFLFLEFKTQHIKCVLFYSYFTLRRILIAVVVIGLQNFARIQIVCLTILFFWIAKYQVIHRPFKTQTSNFLNCVNEVFLVIFCVVLLNFVNPSDANKANLLGFICISMIAVFFIINWGLILPLKVISSLRKCAKKCKKCKKKTTEEKERERLKKVLKEVYEARKHGQNNIISTKTPKRNPQIHSEQYQRDLKNIKVFKMPRNNNN